MTENAFYGADRQFSLYGDLYMTVMRHEVAHQFDRVVQRDSNQMLQNRAIAYRRRAKTDRDWCRASVGNDFFQRSPDEIIPSQVHQSQAHATVYISATTQLMHS